MLRRKVSLRCPLCVLAACALTASSASSDTPSETWSYSTPRALGNCQVYMGPEAQETYTIGLTAGRPKPDEALLVTDVMAGSPASAAGIQKGDLLWGSDSEGNAAVIDSCELLREERSGPGHLVFYRQSADQKEPSKLNVHPKPRREVFPGESQARWKIICEFVDGGRFLAAGALARDSLGDFELKIGIYNSFQAESLLQLDESKIFLLDAQNAEFKHQPFAEWKQQVEGLVASANALAQGMESVPYVPPPPPPPPTHYHISSSVDGRYVLTPIGAGTYQANGQAHVESTVSPEYTTNEQIGQAARGIASLFDAIRIARTNKEIKKLRQRAAANAAAAEKLLADGTAAHLETIAPIAPHAKRSGAVAFVQPTNFSGPPIRAIFVVSDTSTKKEYFVTFEFH